MYSYISWQLATVTTYRYLYLILYCLTLISVAYLLQYVYTQARCLGYPGPSNPLHRCFISTVVSHELPFISVVQWTVWIAQNFKLYVTIRNKGNMYRKIKSNTTLTPFLWRSTLYETNFTFQLYNLNWPQNRCRQLPPCLISFCVKLFPDSRNIYNSVQLKQLFIVRLPDRD